MSKIDTYIRELDRQLADIDPETRASLIEGVREELESLDDRAAQDRMRQLGDPAFVASSAREQIAPGGRARPESPNLTRRRGVQRWLLLITVLLLTIGGLLLTPLAWLAGIVLLWISSTWNIFQKVVGSLTLVAGAAVLFATVLPAVAPSPDPSTPVVIWPTVVTLYVAAALIYIAVSWYLLRTSSPRHKSSGHQPAVPV